MKTVEQQVLATEHRIRESWVSRRTALINQVHGFLLEFGIGLPNTLTALVQAAERLEEPSHALPIRFQELIRQLLDEIRRLPLEIKGLEHSLRTQLLQQEAAHRLLSIPGIGPITASAVAADVGDATQFARSRDFAASLGLVPRQHSTGGENVLLGISKRGNVYLRRLFVQCAHAIMRKADRRDEALGAWIRQLLERKHPNKVACALANKLARLVWAVLPRGSAYDPHFLS